MLWVFPNELFQNALTGLFVEILSIPPKDPPSVLKSNLKIACVLPQTVRINFRVHRPAHLGREVGCQRTSIFETHISASKAHANSKVECFKRIFPKLFEGLEVLEAGFVLW